MRTRQLLSVLALGLAVGGLAACGDDGSGPSATETVTETVTVPASDSTSPSDPSAPAAEPIQFRYVMGSDSAPPACAISGVPSAAPTDIPTVQPSLHRRADPTRPAPSGADCTLFGGAQCPVDSPASVPADQVAVLCEAATDDVPAVKYLLGPALIVGGVVDARSGVPEGQVSPAVTLQLGGRSEEVFTEISQSWTYDVDQFAMVVGGEVLSAPTFAGPISNGMAQITGDFTEDEARELAEAIKAGG